MPKASQPESGRAETHLQVCGTPPAGSASAGAQPCVALGRCCSSQPQNLTRGVRAQLNAYRSQG
jgi:hypothetical protein